MCWDMYKIKDSINYCCSLTNSTLNVQEAYTSTGDSILLVNCAKVISPNVATKGGMIHQVDHVLARMTIILFLLFYLFLFVL